MLKILLKNLNLKEIEQLSREQLKDILGGFTVGAEPTITNDCGKDCINYGGNYGYCTRWT